MSIVMNVPVRPTPALSVYTLKHYIFEKKLSQTCSGQSLAPQNYDEYSEPYDGMLKCLYHNLVLHDQAKQ